MLSYRHSFHAGNHADVIKHLTQLCILQKLTEKNKPAIYIDTHAGAGVYKLDSDEALKTQEYESGVAKLTDKTIQDPLLLSYQRLINQYWINHCYPGSPMIAQHVLRQQDALVLMEFHNTEIDNLKRSMKGTNAQIHHRDGYEGLAAICPPHPKRGLVLIDPPYEHISEYQQLYDCLVKTVGKWPTGVFAIWYPLLSARAGKKSGESERLIEKLQALPVKSVLNVELQVQDNDADAGMYGSGIVILNPPWQVDTMLRSACDELASLLSQQTPLSAKIEWLKSAE